MSGKRLRVLFVLPQISWPPDRGGRIVQYHLMKGIQERHDVWATALIHHPEEYQDAEEWKKECPNLEVFEARPKWSLSLMFKALFSPIPYKVHRFYQPEMAGWVQHCIRENHIDVVHCHNFYTAQYVTGDESSARVLYKENFESLVLERFVKESRHPWLLRQAARRQVSRTRRYEINVCKNFHQVIHISEEDRKKFGACHPKAPLDVVEPGIDLEYYKPSTRPPQPHRVVFTGAMNYFPNVDAVHFFCESIWPLVRQTIPEAEFFIVGQRPEDSVQALHGKNGVTVTGRVEDIRESVHKGAVYVSPLRVGGGIKLKMLEALALGKAVVTTPIGIEGLKVNPGKHLLSRESPEAFAGAVIQLLKQEEQRKQMEGNARAWAEAHGGWERAVEKLEANYYRAVKKKS